jgi:hypothetical protein
MTATLGEIARRKAKIISLPVVAMQFEKHMEGVIEPPGGVMGK